MRISMDWVRFGQGLLLAVGMTMFGLGWVGLADKLAGAVRARLGRSYGVLALAWIVIALAWVAVVSGALTLGG